jgi:hypothetical protein
MYKAVIMVMLAPLKIDATANKLLGFPLLGKSQAETSRTKTEGHESVRRQREK